MELLIVIVPILIGYIIISIQDWITNVRFYRRRMQKELDKIRMSLGKVECVKTTLSTGEVETLGPDKVFIEDKQKVETVTEELEEMGAAEKLIKEAKEKKV